LAWARVAFSGPRRQYPAPTPARGRTWLCDPYPLRPLRGRALVVSSIGEPTYPPSQPSLGFFVCISLPHIAALPILPSRAPRPPDPVAHPRGTPVPSAFISTLFLVYVRRSPFSNYGAVPLLPLVCAPELGTAPWLGSGSPRLPTVPRCNLSAQGGSAGDPSGYSAGCEVFTVCAGGFGGVQFGCCLWSRK